jgi:hypothetical protein
MGGPQMNAAMGANSGSAQNANMAAMMQQHGGQQAGGTGSNAALSGPPSQEQMAAMMKQGQGNPSEQMAAMMKQHGSGAPGGAGGTPNSQMNEQMAAMMKQQQAGQAGGGSGPPTKEQMEAMMKQNGIGRPAGAGGPGGGMNEQMAAMMRQQAGRGGGGPNVNIPGGQANPGGQGQPGSAGGQGKNFPPGSADEALFMFCTAMEEGDTAKASEYVSPKAKGILGDLRDGKLSDEKIEEITNLVSPVSELAPNGDQNSSTKRSLRNGKEQVMSFTLKKEKDVYRITDLTFKQKKKTQ